MHPKLTMRLIKGATICMLFLVILLNSAIVGLSLDGLFDFGSFAASGINAAKGINPYDPSSPLVFESEFPSVGSGGRLPNLNPPVTLLVFSLVTEQNVHFAL